MIQNVQSHVRRLNSEKTSIHDEFELYKIQYQQRIQGIAAQCKYICAGLSCTSSPYSHGAVAASRVLSFFSGLSITIWVRLSWHYVP